MSEHNINPEGKALDDQQTNWSQRAFGKAKIVRPLMDLRPIPPDLMTEACKRAAELLNKAHVSSQTIYNWIKDYREGGLKALEQKGHRNRGESTLHPDLRQYVEDLLKSSKSYSLAEIHRRAVQKAEELELIDDLYPTYDQIRFIDTMLSAAVKKYGREGRRAYRSTNELASRFEAEGPNEIWQCDHHLLDILILNEETGNAERPWITVIIDDFSRAIMGFYMSFANPNSNSIALALHHAMCTKPQELWVMHGIPTVFYVDNGKDFRSRHIEEVCLHFRIERRSHEPYLARSKGKIERWFRTLEEMLIAYEDGYVGSSTKKRPEKITPKLTLDQLRERILTFILKTYHEKIHSGTNAKPRARWSEAPKVIRVVDHLQDLDHLLESAARTVQNDGIQFRKEKYVDKDGKLTGYIGKEVRVFFNRNDVSTLRVYGHAGEYEQYLCTAHRNLPTEIITEQNKVIRKELKLDNQASKQRLRGESRQRQSDSAPASAQSAKPKQPQPTVAPLPIRRYRFEIEEEDSDTNATD